MGQACRPDRARLRKIGAGDLGFEADLPSVSGAVPNQAIPADDLGRAMVDAVLGTVEREARIFENRDIRTVVKS